MAYLKTIATTPGIRWHDMHVASASRLARGPDRSRNIIVGAVCRVLVAIDRNWRRVDAQLIEGLRESFLRVWNGSSRHSQRSRGPASVKRRRCGRDIRSDGFDALAERGGIARAVHD